MATTFWGKRSGAMRWSPWRISPTASRGEDNTSGNSVAHLGISKRARQGLVSGSSLYGAGDGDAAPGRRWRRLRESCAGRVGSLLRAAQGKVSGEAMGALTHSRTG